jgi:hypothetical protein
LAWEVVEVGLLRLLVYLLKDLVIIQFFPFFINNLTYIIFKL